MKRITSFGDARKMLAQIKRSVDGITPSIEALHEFIRKVETTLSAVGELRGEKAGSKKVVPPLNGVPQDWADRVIYILKHSDKPMRQKEIVDKYEAMGWPKTGNLYTSISGSVAYLFHRKKVIDRNNNGYFMKK